MARLTTPYNRPIQLAARGPTPARQSSQTGPPTSSLKTRKKKKIYIFIFLLKQKSRQIFSFLAAL